jgi:hypothetical protein
MTTMNQWIRRQAGRDPTPTPELERERPVGDIVGRGVPGPAAFPRRPVTNATVNERIRKGAAVVRSVELRNGLTIDLDDPWR